MSMTVDSATIESELARLQETQLNRDDVNEIVSELGKIIGVEDLALDESGVAELIVDEEVELSLLYLPALPGIVAAISMPEGPEDNDQLLRKLLQTNMSWAMTQGGCFVYVPPRVALCRLVPLTSHDSERLDHELAAFVELGKAWRKEINAFMEEGDQASVESVDEEEAAPGIRV